MKHFPAPVARVHHDCPAGSFVEAGHALHVTPAALSTVIKDLEETLRFRVFDRTTRRVDLSEMGRQYFHYAEQVLIDLRKAEMFATTWRTARPAWCGLPPRRS